MDVFAEGGVIYAIAKELNVRIVIYTWNPYSELYEMREDTLTTGPQNPTVYENTLPEKDIVLLLKQSGPHYELLRERRR